MTTPTTINTHILDFILGKTIRQVYVDGSSYNYKEGDYTFVKDYEESVDIGEEIVVLEFTDDTAFVLAHRQECCENVVIKDIVGNFEDLIGHPLLEAEVCQSENEKNPGADEQFTFFKFATIKANVNMSWFGHSNGNYSMSVSGSLKEKRNKDVYCDIDIRELGVSVGGRIYIHINTNHEELLHKTSDEPVRIVDMSAIKKLVGGNPDNYSSYTQEPIKGFDTDNEHDFYPSTVGLKVKNINPKLRAVSRLRFEGRVGETFLKTNGKKPNFGLVLDFEEMASERMLTHNGSTEMRKFICLVTFKGFKYI